MKTNGEEQINAVIEQVSHGAGMLSMDCTNTGLTKREYFAAMAMQGILSDTADRGENYVAIQSVKIADALIEALNK